MKNGEGHNAEVEPSPEQNGAAEKDGYYNFSYTNKSSIVSTFEKTFDDAPYFKP